jgi:dTDP-4-amino-4,6-dideoxygalactose transaminase
MNIPFLDLTAQYERLRPTIDSAVRRVLERGHFILGEEVAAFEREFATYCGAKHAVAVASGTEAIQLALLACGINRGDEVITSAHTAVATVAAIEMAGAHPVLVDINPFSYTLDPVRVAAAVTPRTRAVVPVHLYGCPANLSPLLEIAHANQLFIIEDCAQSLGARYRGKQVGTWGNIGAFSFYPTKNLGAYGDGGAIVTEDEDLAERVRLLRQYGWDPDRVSDQKGINSRLDELQAAILRAKLPDLDASNARRRELAGLYRSFLAGSEVGLPSTPVETEPVYHLFVIRHAQRDALRLFLAGRGIDTQVHYPVPIHLQKAYLNLGYCQRDLPETECASREVLSLPLYPEMTDEMVEQVSLAVLDFSGR